MELHSCIINENPEQEKDLNLSNLLKTEFCDVTGKKTLLKNAAEIQNSKSRQVVFDQKRRFV